MKCYSLEIIMSKDITETFNKFCGQVYFGRNILLMESKMHTMKFLAEVQNVRMHTVVQCYDNASQFTFLN
jgi:hypothetical protein